MRVGVERGRGWAQAIEGWDLIFGAFSALCMKRLHSSENNLSNHQCLSAKQRRRAKHKKKEMMIRDMRSIIIALVKYICLLQNRRVMSLFCKKKMQ